MKAPDTIYIAPNHYLRMFVRAWFDERHDDTDVAYVRADLSAYELGKIIEAQKAEIARLRQLLTVHGRHTYACKQKYGPRHDCTCGFTAALTGGSMMWTDETPQETMLNMAMHEIKTLTQTVADLRAERERHIDALKRIDEGPHHSMANDEVASWARHIAFAALASPPACNDPAEAERIHQEGVALANLFRQIQPPRDAEKTK